MNALSLWSRRVMLMPLCVCACLLFSFACGSKPEAGGEEEDQGTISSVEVRAARVAQGPIRQVIQVTGTLNALPNRDVKVSPLVPGRIDELVAIEGARVTEGQIVAKLDDSTLRDGLTQARASLENAQLNEQRMQKLFERGIAAGKEKEDAHRDFLSAQAALDAAQLQVARAQVRAPISGSVVQRFVSVGEQVDGTGGQPILEIADFDPIILTASVPASFLAALHVEQRCAVKTEAYPDSVFDGELDTILPAMNTDTNTATVRIRIANPDLRLKGGMFVTAGIVTSVHQSALYVPTAALVITNDEPKVYVVGTDSKVQERRVKPGWRDGDSVEILEGVNKDETVVTTGSYGLADQMKVTIKEKD